MHKKVIIFLFFASVIAGCAGTSRINNRQSPEMLKDALDVIESTESKNLTSGGFFIHRGRITTSGESGRISLIFTMKFSPPSNYLISIRSKAGMEAFRVYLTSDTVLINDRLNKTVLYGNIVDFERIAGLPAALLKVSLGDLFVLNPLQHKDIKSDDDIIKIEEYFMGLTVKSTLDTKISKVRNMMVTTGVPDEFISIQYKNFRFDNKALPRKVEINDFRRKIKIMLSLDKYTSPWFGDISFIPGSGYNVKPLI